MIIENEGVILKKDHSVHHVFLTLLPACLCNTILLEMGYRDRKMRYWDFFLSIAVTVQETLDYTGMPLLTKLGGYDFLLLTFCGHIKQL